MPSEVTRAIPLLPFFIDLLFSDQDVRSNGPNLVIPYISLEMQ